MLIFCLNSIYTVYTPYTLYIYTVYTVYTVAAIMHSAGPAPSAAGYTYNYLNMINC